MLSLSCAREAALEDSVSDDTISATAILIEDGVMIGNVSDVDCIVFVTSPEGKQQFGLAAGESVMVTDYNKTD